MTPPTTLFIDNSRLEAFTTCPRKGQYVIHDQRIPAGESSALNLGSAAHLALRYRYSRIGTSAVTQDFEARQMYLIEKFFEKHPVPPDEYRSAGYCQLLMQGYNKANPQETFAIKTAPTELSESLIEMPFSVPLGKVDNTNIIWTGKIDLVVGNDVEETYVLDHKTASIGGEGYFLQYYNATQFLGYMYALRASTGILPVGFVIDALFTRKITPTGKGVEFQRHAIRIEPDRVDEWQQNTLVICADYLHCLEREYFPMHQTQCVQKFGTCDYHQVCTMSAASRPVILNGPAYKHDDWSPLHQEDDELMAMADAVDLSSYTFVQPTVSPTKNKRDVITSESVMKDLGLV